MDPHVNEASRHPSRPTDPSQGPTNQPRVPPHDAEEQLPVAALETRGDPWSYLAALWNEDVAGMYDEWANGSESLETTGALTKGVTGLGTSGGG
jgi:hypothetical protein